MRSASPQRRHCLVAAPPWKDLGRAVSLKEGEVQGLEITETKLGFGVHPWVPAYPRQERVSTLH